MLSLPVIGSIAGSSSQGVSLADLLTNAINAQGGAWWSGDYGIGLGSAPNINTWTPKAQNGITGDLVGGAPATGLKPDASTISTPAGAVDAVKFSGGTVLDGEEMQHSGISSLWDDFHKAAGSTIFLVARTTGAGNGGFVLDTGGSASNQVGIAVGFNGGTNRFDFYLADATGGGDYVALVGLDLDDYSLAPTDLHVYEIAWSNAGGYSIRVDDENPVTGSLARAPSSAGAAASLVAGSITAGSVAYLFGEIVDLALIKGVVGTTERGKIRKALGAKVGIPLA